MTQPDDSPDGGRVGRAPDSTSPSLLDRVQHGDPDGWQRLVFLYRPLVLWWCRRRGLGEQEAEDATQEVFQAVHQAGAGLHAGGFRHWLRRTTAHKAVDQLRRRGGARAAGGSDALEILGQVSAAGGGEPDEPDERAVLARRAMELIRDRFEERTWQAAWRTAAEGQPAAGVAADLGMTVGAARTAKSRVLAELRKVLQELGE